IATYLITEKHLNTFIKCNPTLLGYEYARKTMDDMGYGYVQFGDFHFKDDLQYTDAVPMLRRLLELADSKGLAFGVKLTNTFPVDVKRNELPSEEMYMSGKSLYALTLSVASKLSHDFDGKLRISYSGGADFFNIDKIFKLGIWPITMATTVLKPGGYNRMVQIAELIENSNTFGDFGGVDVAGLDRLLEEAKTDPRHVKAIKPAPERKISKKVPLTDCFFAPCEQGCPINQDITSYMKLVTLGRQADAMKVIGLKNPLPFITGTICAHRCMGRCTRNFYEEPVHIRTMKLKAAEDGYGSYLSYVKAEAAKIAKTGRKAAVVGAGPAGIAAAYFLARAGIETTVFEKRQAAGGIVRNVIPSFRIANEAIEKDAALAEAMGVRFEYGREIGSLDELKGFDSVILAVGAEKKGNVRLESGEAVNAIDFLEKFKSAPDSVVLGKNVVTIGGGNTAMDTARAAKRAKGVEHSYLVYRRDRRNMPADEQELKEALKDGVEFMELLAPLSLADGKLRCEKQRLGEYDASGRRGIESTGEFCEIPADTVIAAVGEKVDTDLYKKLGLEVDDRGKAKTDADGQTSVKGVYVAGDALNGPATVVEAIRDARKAADAVIAGTSFKESESTLMTDAVKLV
ncbi:MAG: FAD-dependent oxidoreductase, partial [Lachnospiraceae bacterium]|nr:FAD-dependent oxidoreductase [Lachnospiraceae bacterium]